MNKYLVIGLVGVGVYLGLKVAARQSAQAKSDRQAAAIANPALAAIRQNLKAANVLAAGGKQTDGMFQFGMAANAYNDLNDADKKAIAAEMNATATNVGMLAIY